MEMKNPFDRALEARRGIPLDVKDAAIWVTDTLDLCWASAQAVFGEKATPEVALSIFDRVVERIEDVTEYDEGEGEIDL